MQACSAFLGGICLLVRKKRSHASFRTCCGRSSFSHTLEKRDSVLSSDVPPLKYRLAAAVPSISGISSLLPSDLDGNRPGVGDDGPPVPAPSAFGPSTTAPHFAHTASPSECTTLSWGQHIGSVDRIHMSFGHARYINLTGGLAGLRVRHPRSSHSGKRRSERGAPPSKDSCHVYTFRASTKMVAPNRFSAYSG